MGDTEIEWTNKTWNPVTGCTKVSPGCDHCYAETVTNRFKRQDFSDIVLHPERLEEPLHWRNPQKVFVCSMSDLFHKRVPWPYTARIFQVMQSQPRHTFQVLTKRPGLMAYFAKHIWPAYSHDWPPNVWAGTSVENQKYTARVELLRQVPAKVRFVSLEPLLGPIDLTRVDLLPSIRRGMRSYFKGQEMPPEKIAKEMENLTGKAWMNVLTGDFFDGWDSGTSEPWLNWVIVGGESGPGARPMHPQWATDIRDQCEQAGVPFFFKQWGAWGPWEPFAGGDLGGDMRRGIVDQVNGDGREIDGHFRRGDVYMRKVGKKAAGALLDGREWKEMPGV